MKDRTGFMVYVPALTRAKLQRRADDEGESLSAVCRAILDREVRDDPKPRSRK
jgi:hypothetical protein